MKVAGVGTLIILMCRICTIECYIKEFLTILLFTITIYYFIKQFMSKSMIISVFTCVLNITQVSSVGIPFPNGRCRREARA